MAHDRAAHGPSQHHDDPASITGAGAEPVENIWQCLRANWLSNRVFETYEEIIDACCEAWNRLMDLPDTIRSIGTREWAIIGQR